MERNHLFFVCLFLFIISHIHGHELIAAESQASNLSTNGQKIKTLYEELQGFKNDPKFHKMGFGRCCRFYKWMEKVENLRSKATAIEILSELGFVPGDLLMLGMEYMKTQGDSSSYTLYMEPIIFSGLKPVPKIKEGQGLVIRMHQACINLNTIKEFFKAINDGDYGKAVLPESKCPSVYEKTVVTGPLAKEKIIGAGTYYQVNLPNGEKVWMGSSEVEFKGND